MLNCLNLKVIFIPSSISIIQDSAFEGCRSLVTINIPSSIKSVGKDAFKNCNKLNCNLVIDNKSDLAFARSLIYNSQLPYKCLCECNPFLTCRKNQKQMNKYVKVLMFCIST
jgi:hypothetical protein